MKAGSSFYRSGEIRRIRSELERDSFPRLQMFLLVALTGGSGFLTSFVLLRSGVVEMWIRYLLSFGIAYVVFLILLWLWLRTRADQYSDLVEVAGGLPSGSNPSASGYTGKGGTFDGGATGKGGTFDGGGASGSYEMSSEAISAADQGITDKAIGSVAEADEFAIPLAVVLVIAAILFSSLFMIYSAPVLFAELVVDGVLSATLFRRLRGIETRHWLETALRHTALPFALTAVIVSASGWAMVQYAPDADSIGDFISHVSRDN